VTQRVVADCTNKEKISGFTRTNTFRALSEKEQAYFQVLYNDPQYRYTFASREEIIKYIQRDSSAQEPSTELIAKDYSAGITPFEKSGASSIENISKSTEQHHHHWQDYFRMHTHIAIDKANTTKAKNEIKGIYSHYLSQAVMMDDSEIYYKIDFDSENIEELRKAPLTIRAALEIMYEIANETETSGSPLQTNALSIPNFGPITASGIGSSAEIMIGRNGSFPQGSGAAPEHEANPYWYKQLNKRRSITGGNQYIRGHLLNDHMGGPARPYNLIPLCSDTNMAHFGLIEKKAKDALQWMIENRSNPKSPSLSDIMTIYYKVFVLKPGQDRPSWSLRFRTAPENFNAVLSEMKPSNSDPTVEEFKHYVKKTHGDITYMNYFQMPIRAVNATEDDNVKIITLMPLIIENAKLWDMEDKEVPGKIGYQLEITTQGGKESYPGSFDNIVPDNGRLKFRP
jgi:hypothetical protein